MAQSIFSYVKKYWVRFVIVVFAVLFFLLAHRYFVINLEKDGRTIEEQVENLEVTNPNEYRFNVEALSRYDERNYIHNLSGWAFSLNPTNNSSNQIETFIVLASNKNEFYFETVSIERPDVIEAFIDLELDIIIPGFSTLINQQLLPKDEYCIGILLKNLTNSSFQFINTNHALLRKGRTLEFTKEDNSVCGRVFDEYEPIVENFTLPEITDQIKFFLDGLSKIDDNSGSYNLIGWAFTTIDENQPTNIFETKIVLFNQSKSFKYEALSTPREDVVDAFKELNLEIVKPGYQVTLSTDQLLDGDYCLGILLTDNQEEPDQFVVTNKIIKKRGSVLELLEDTEEYCEDVYVENINYNSD